MSALLPLYCRIKQARRSWILIKEYHPGAKTPTEKEMAEHCNVNRLMARRPFPN